MAYNKVIYGGKVLIDLTNDTVEANKVLKGYTAHDKSGALITGASTYDADTSDATAKASTILSGSTAYVNGKKIVGDMVNNGAITKNIKSKSEPVIIPNGFHDGSGTVGIDSVEAAKLIPENIRNGINILGVVGNIDPTSELKIQAKTVTPSTSKQTIAPDKGYDYLSSVVINAISFLETPNPAGGMTATIAG